jgi:hypothetical protein
MPLVVFGAVFFVIGLPIGVCFVIAAARGYYPSVKNGTFSFQFEKGDGKGTE